MSDSDGSVQVKQVLELADLGVAPLWAPPRALRRTVTGVTTADMENPSTYLSPGEIVLTGLVWWQPDHNGAARAFVSALRAAGAVALIAGEGVHGAIPDELFDACRDHELPLFSVPQSTTFRAILDRIYVWLWANIRESGAPALPSIVKDELLTGIASAAPVDAVLRTAVERLELPGLALVSPAGRVIASSDPHAADCPQGTQVPVTSGQDSPFDGWWLRTGRAVGSRRWPVLNELAALFSTRLAQHRERLAARGAAAGALLAGLDSKGTPARSAAVHACGLPGDVALTPVVVSTPGAPAAWAVDAANELFEACAVDFAVCPGGSAEAVGFVAAPPDRLAPLLSEQLPPLQRLVDDVTIAVGVGPSARPSDLAPALHGARFLADAAGRRPGSGPRVRTGSALTSLSTLLEGVPAPVSHAFQMRTIGPVISYDTAKGTELLLTLATFLENRASWTRTAAALHLHVNTVHYRIERAEALTGRRVSDPDDQSDLCTALILHQQSHG